MLGWGKEGRWPWATIFREREGQRVVAARLSYTRCHHPSLSGKTHQINIPSQPLAAFFVFLLSTRTRVLCCGPRWASLKYANFLLKCFVATALAIKQT